ncbi:Ig-like domain-containing protein [uncultured Ruminococcus sp.]|uniref:Ig-like domain-containing protein n=1 Tax=uncultured Ruminococcus sp. TaxID=165186 RepID=UPI0025899A21|nr:Ig-like domain-containing protein [uncultured Ruminococcus sp.]
MKHNFRNSVVALLLVTITLLSSLTSVLADSISEDDNINYTNIINLVIGQSYVFNYDNDNITNCTSENTDVVGAINNGSIYAINYGTSDVTVTTTNTTYTYKVNVIRKKLVDTYVTILPTNSFKIELDNVFPDGVEKNNGLFPEPKYTFTSADESIASVSDDGIVTGKSEGETEIKVKFGSDKHILNLYVTVDFPYIDLKDMTINAGEKKRIDYTRGAYQKMNCYSSDPSVATIDNKACITGIKKGTSTINIIIGDLRCTATITVKNDPSLNITNKTIYTGNSFNLKVIGLVGNATFTSSNSKAATVNSNGKVTCKSAGNSNITVIANGVTLKCKVRVINPFIKYKSKIYIKNSTTISIRGKVGKATFKSSNNKIATVNSKGKITGKKKGTCTIIIRTNGVTLKIRITVINPRLNKNSIRLIQGKTFKLKVYGGNGKVKYSSSNNRITTVSKYGSIRAKYAGSCNITIIRNGIKLVCKIKVTASKYPVGLKYNFKQTKKNITRHMSETFNLSSYYKIDSNAKALYKSKKCSKKQYQNVKLTNLVKFKSSDNKVASVYANGKIKAKTKGNCTITVTLYNKKTYTYSLKIADKLTEKTLKNGKKVKYVYSYNELLKELYNVAKTHIVKGLKNPYYGYACMFENNFKVTNDIDSQIVNIKNDLNNKYGSFMITIDTICNYSSIQAIAKSKETNSIICVAYDWVDPYLKKYYSIVHNILKKININNLKNINDKVYAIFNYLATNFTYEYTDVNLNGYFSPLVSLLTKKGVCTDSANCASYICAVEGIECYNTVSETANHEINVIKADNGQYYFCDCTAGSEVSLFIGSREIFEIQKHNEFKNYIKEAFNITVSARSFPYMTEEDKKDFNSEVPTKEYLEWKYGDCDFKNGCTYLCDENVLKSLGIKPTN